MTVQVNHLTSQQKLQRAIKTLEAARSLQKDSLALGVDAISRHINGVDSDWLANWPSAPTNSEAAQSSAKILHVSTKTQEPTLCR